MFQSDGHFAVSAMSNSDAAQVQQALPRGLIFPGCERMRISILYEHLFQGQNGFAGMGSTGMGFQQGQARLSLMGRHANVTEGHLLGTSRSATVSPAATSLVKKY